MFQSSTGTTKPCLLITEGDTWCGFYIGQTLLKSYRNNVNKIVMAVKDPHHEFAKELEKMGAEIRQYDPINMDKNLIIKELFRNDIDGMVLVPIHDLNNMVKASKLMIEAAEMDNKLKCLLLWSTLGVQIGDRTTRTGLSKNAQWSKMFHSFQEVEQRVRESKMEHECILRLNFVSQQFFGLAQVIQSRGMFPLPSGKAKFAPVNANDAAEATARMISSPEMMKQFNKQMLTLTGPKTYSGQDITKIMNSTLNSKIEFQEVSLDDLEKILEANHTLDEFDVHLTMAYMDMLKEDKLDTTTQDLQKILGKAPRDIDTFFKDNANSFRPHSVNPALFLAESLRMHN